MNLAVMRERLDYQSLLLGVVVMVTCALLALAYQLTREPIQQALADDMRQSFSQGYRIICMTMICWIMPSRAI